MSDRLRAGQDIQRGPPEVRTGNQPSVCAAIRNLVAGAFRHAGYANITHARRWHGRDEQRVPALYGYA